MLSNIIEQGYESDYSIHSSDYSIHSSDYSIHSSGSELSSLSSNTILTCESSDSSDNFVDESESTNSYRKQKQKYKQKQRTTCIQNIIEKTNGCTSNLTKDTPFINYLIEKRINFCQLGVSSHIAAFVPVSGTSRSCFKHYGKWKGRYR